MFVKSCFTATCLIANESDFFKGVMGAIIVNGILQEVKKRRASDSSEANNIRKPI